MTEAVQFSRKAGRRRRTLSDGKALLVAATHAFARRGFEAADLRSIAATAGVSPNLVRVHFGSKAELWEACLNAIVVAAAEVMTDLKTLTGAVERPLDERLRDLIARVTDFYADHPDVRDFAVRLASETPERATLLTDRLLRPAYEAARPLLSAGIEAGIIRSSHPCLFFALLNNALNQPLAFPVLLNRLAPEIDLASAQALLIDTTIATLLHLPARTDASVRNPSQDKKKRHGVVPLSREEAVCLLTRSRLDIIDIIDEDAFRDEVAAHTKNCVDLGALLDARLPPA